METLRRSGELNTDCQSANGILNSAEELIRQAGLMISAAVQATRDDQEKIRDEIESIGGGTV